MRWLLETMRCTSAGGGLTLLRWKTLILGDTKHFLVQVQQMKSQKRDEEAMRAKEKEALAKESAARYDNIPKGQQTKDLKPLKGKGGTASGGDGRQVC